MPSETEESKSPYTIVAELFVSEYPQDLSGEPCNGMLLRYSPIRAIYPLLDVILDDVDDSDSLVRMGKRLRLKNLGQ